MEIDSDVKVDFGTNAYGVRREVMLEGDQIVTKQTYDAEPLLEAAAATRLATAGDRWGDGHFVGIVPMAELVKINEMYQGAEERKKQMVIWLKNNPAFVTFDKFLK